MFIDSIVLMTVPQLASIELASKSVTTYMHVTYSMSVCGVYVYVRALLS